MASDEHIRDKQQGWKLQDMANDGHIRVQTPGMETARHGK